MKPLLKLSLFTSLYLCLAVVWANPTKFPSLPEPVTNNAIAKVSTRDGDYFLSFMGLGKGKTYQDVHNKVWVLKLGDKQWQPKKPVPASLPLTGRLASVAVGVGQYAYLFGGYTVDANHQEISSPDAYRYDVLLDTYVALPSMPVPVDDSVALVYRQRYIYLISGWHNAGNVNLVQVYDIKTNTWHQASPFLGVPVFGQAGALVANTMVVCDGVAVQPQLLKRRTYQGISQCLKGVIDQTDPYKIDWQLLKHPTGQGRYRMAAAGHKGKMYFLAGSTTPYNYNGIGYNGKPAPASGQLWVFEPQTNRWHIHSTATIKTMDHRGLLFQNNTMLTIGGMDNDQQVMSRIHARLVN